MEQELQKHAAMAIRTLKEEKAELVQEIDILTAKLGFYKRASALAFKLNNAGSVATEDLPDAIQDFNEKTEEELSIIEKAAELSSKAGQPLPFGRLSDASEANGLTAEDVFLNGLMED